MSVRALWSFIVLMWLRPLERCIMAIDATSGDLLPIIWKINHHQYELDKFLNPNERDSETIHVGMER